MPAKDYNLPEWYNYNKMTSVLYDRECSSPLRTFMTIFDVGIGAARRRYTYGNLRHDDTIKIARALKMTPREYCECFLDGVFEELTEED